MKYVAILLVAAAISLQQTPYLSGAPRGVCMIIIKIVIKKDGEKYSPPPPSKHIRPICAYCSSVWTGVR